MNYPLLSPGGTQDRTGTDTPTRLVVRLRTLEGHNRVQDPTLRPESQQFCPVSLLRLSGIPSTGVKISGCEPDNELGRDQADRQPNLAVSHLMQTTATSTKIWRAGAFTKKLLKATGILYLVTPALLSAAVLTGASGAESTTRAPRDGYDSTRRTTAHFSSIGPTASLDSYLRARSAWKSGDVAGALSSYEEAGRADRSALAPRVATGLALVLRDPSGAVDAWRDAIRVLWQDYRSERWVVRNAIMLIALAGCFGGVALGLGLTLRHIRVVHHTLSETLAWSVSAGRASPVLAWALLASPVIAGAGLVATSLFYVFLCSSRLRGGERILALWAAVWAILLGPVLLACNPLWSRHPSGRDAALIAEIQLDPAGRPNRDLIDSWHSDSPDDPIPLYLAGLSLLRRGDAGGAIDHLVRCKASGEIPAAVLETNLANAWAALNRDELAMQHYQRAISGEERCFEAHYNLSVILARNGRYVEADRALDNASRIDLDRLRSLGRSDAPGRPGVLLNAHLSPGQLWTLDLRNPPGADPPPVLAGLMPLRSLHWGGAVALMAVLLGLWADRWIRRLLHVHVCYQCGTPVCRRCLRRLDRRAYCGRCAESMGGLGAGESTRILIRRLLDERPTWQSQVATTLASVVPGVGAVVRGSPGHGAVASLLAGVAAALLLFPLWSTPYSPVAGPGLWHDIARHAGIAAIALSYAVTIGSTRSGPQRRGSLRAFLDRDVDRMAA